jgi:cell division protein DivIC
MLYRILHFIDSHRFYSYTIAALVVWLTFIDDNDLGSTIRLHKRNNELQREIDFYNEKLVEVNTHRSQVLGSMQLQEKFAREVYFMKQPNEDVYVLVDENNKIIKK